MGGKMSFDLFGFEVLPKWNLYGLWVGGVTTEHRTKYLFLLYCEDGEFEIQLFFLKLIRW